jgi:hypothetical protein
VLTHHAIQSWAKGLQLGGCATRHHKEALSIAAQREKPYATNSFALTFNHAATLAAGKPLNLRPGPLLGLDLGVVGQCGLASRPA